MILDRDHGLKEIFNGPGMTFSLGLEFCNSNSIRSIQLVFSFPLQLELIHIWKAFELINF